MLLSPLLIKAVLLVESASKQEDWEKVLHLSDKLLSKGYKNNLIYFWRGRAFLNLNRHEEALEAFEKIQGKLGTIEEDAIRYWNQTLALYKADRAEEAYKLLMEKIDPDWPTWAYRRARNFLAEHGFKAFKIKV